MVIRVSVALSLLFLGSCQHKKLYPEARAFCEKKAARKFASAETYTMSQMSDGAIYCDGGGDVGPDSQEASKYVNDCLRSLGHIPDE